MVNTVKFQYNGKNGWHVSENALNVGEKSLPGTRYKLDRYCEETNTAHVYHGFVLHGCQVCFSDNSDITYRPLTKQSLVEWYALTMKTKAYLEYLGMKYVCIRDHEFHKLKN